MKTIADLSAADQDREIIQGLAELLIFHPETFERELPGLDDNGLALLLQPSMEREAVN